MVKVIEFYIPQSFRRTTKLEFLIPGLQHAEEAERVVGTLLTCTENSANL